MGEFGSRVPPEVQREAEAGQKRSRGFLADMGEQDEPDMAGGEKLSGQRIEGKEGEPPDELDPLSQQGGDTSNQQRDGAADQQAAGDCGQQGDNSAATQQQGDMPDPFKSGDSSADDDMADDSDEADELIRARSHKSRRLFDGLR